MRTMTIKVALLAGLAVVLGAGTSSAQALQYAGSLHMGLSDLNNEVTGQPPTNNALPICAGKGPLVNTDPAGTTEGTLLINAVGSGSTAVGGTLTFNAVGGGNGGAQEKENATCNVANIPFANPRLRSRTQVGAAHFPGRKGDWTPNISTAPTPATPSATYMLSAGGGNTQATTAANFTTVWTITDEAGPVGPLGTPAPITTFTEMGAAHSAAVPFLAAAGGGAFRIQQAASQFGGGVPFSLQFAHLYFKGHHLLELLVLPARDNESVETRSSSKKKPPSAFPDGDESRRWRFTTNGRCLVT